MAGRDSAVKKLTFMKSASPRRHCRYIGAPVQCQLDIIVDLQVSVPFVFNSGSPVKTRCDVCVLISCKIDLLFSQVSEISK